MCFALQMQVNFCNATHTMNFLPMEDALSSARNITPLENSNVKPYRESFSIGNKTQNEGLLSFSNTDILAFVLLAGVYFILVRRRSKPRNISL